MFGELKAFKREINWLTFGKEKGLTKFNHKQLIKSWFFSSYSRFNKAEIKREKFCNRTDFRRRERRKEKGKREKRKIGISKDDISGKMC